MTSSLRHIALIVHGVRAAEAYYRAVFDMELIGREARLDDGLWYTLPFDSDWEDAQAAGVDITMVALRRDTFVLALFEGDASPGQVYAIGLQIAAEEIGRVRDRLPASQFRVSRPDYLEFLDPYGIVWQISPPGTEFRTAGELTNRWLRL